jgi:hypothetical protein
MLRRLLILTHRYLGIPLSVLFVLWFVTGIAMIYVGGMPTLAPQTRLERLPPLDLAAVRVTPVAAAAEAAAGFGRATLTTILGRPAYRFASRYGSATIFADDGTSLDEIDRETARRVAGEFLGVGENDVTWLETVERPDQWTLQLGGDLPLEKFAVADGAGTEVYVSTYSAEVRQLTTTRTRMLAWIATIPHWFYITPLRSNQPVWYWTVVGAAGLGCVLALLGLALGVTQFHRSQPFRLRNAVRYRGAARWHYLLGCVFGLFALTWVFSGLLSMEPFEWTDADGIAIDSDALNGGPVEFARFAPAPIESWSAVLGGRTLKELEFRQIHDEPYYLARYTEEDPAAVPRRERLHQPYDVGGRGAPRHFLVSARTLEERREPFSTDDILARLALALPDTPIAAHDLLTAYDSYYYSRNGQAALPVLRIKLADPLETWVYVDTAQSQVVASVHRLHRLERWLYNGLHSLDFGFWYDRRPLWDIGMIVLSLGALATSSIGLWLGFRRLVRGPA